MLKDRRDDFDDNDDADLNSMIHQYNEDNELRRKINEMKKQKENAPVEPTIDPTDSALTGTSFPTKKEESGIPNIRADQDVEKTRVGFNDDRDKTLVIMDHKTKVESKSEDMYDDYSYVDTQHTATAFRAQAEEESEYKVLRSEIKDKKSKKKSDDIVEDEKTKKINKIIMITIISIISIVLLVGVGFGIKYAFFNSDTTESETDTDKKTTTTNKKKPTTTNKTDKDDIEDNSAEINRLRTQLTTYQGQLDAVNAKLVDAQTQINLQQGKIDTIAVLKQNLDVAAAAVITKEAEYKKAQGTTSTACSTDKTSEACTTATAAEQVAFTAFKQAETDRATTQTAYDTEYNKTAEYKSLLKTAQDTYNALDKQKIDLEKKVADTNTELTKYE